MRKLAMNRNASLLIFAVLVLSGCATHKAMRPPANCSAGSCTFAITVHSCADIRASRDPIVVDLNYSGPIFWELATPGWSFADNGIHIRQGSDNEFDGKDKQARKFKWNNKHNNKHKDYKYDVNVIADGTTKVCSWDPTIMN